MAVFSLSRRNFTFPSPELADEDGLLAIGGDLSVKRLLLAYSSGIFPWYNEGEPICWWCPKERFIIPPEEIHISQSMRKLLRRNPFTITFNQDFPGVIRQCRTLREDDPGTWITDEMEEAFIRLAQAGYGLSVEVFKDRHMVGGLYGVRIGRCFFGESMFSIVPNASKAALITLAQKLASEGFVMIDCQFHTRHLASMGGRYITWDDYKQRLREGLPFTPDI